MFLFKKKSNFKKVIEGGKTRKIEFGNNALSYQVGNLQQIGARRTQEDSFALINALDVHEISQNGLFAIVADGMGGMKDGKLVSEAAVAGFVQAFRKINMELDIPRQLRDSVTLVNNNLYSKFNGEGGTTAVLIMIYRGAAFWVSVGDSSIYLKRKGGLFKINKDHTYLNDLYANELDNEVVDKRDVEENIDGVRLSEFLGNSSIDEIDYNIKPLLLEKDDVILLCSDGISSFLDENAISAALAYPPELACAHLHKAIEHNFHKNQDNYTAIVISCLN